MAGLDIKVLKSIKNVLLSRKELELSIMHNGKSTPTRDELTSTISSIYSAPKNQIYVFNINTGFGVHKSTAIAHIYNSFDDLKAIEKDSVVTKITGQAKPKIKRMLKKQDKNKKRKLFGSLRRIKMKAEKKAKN